MKILWCTHSLAGFKPEVGGYHGCGWITSLLDQFANLDGIEIGVAFFYGEDAEPLVKDRITYYPIKQRKVSALGKIKTFFGDYSAWEGEETYHLDKLQEIIEKFKPDVIHVWGTETDMGLIAKRVDLPVIVHLQGLLNPIFNALLPPGVNQNDFLFKDGLNPIKILNNLNALNYWEYKTSREVRILKSCKKYFGRTHWDKAISRLYSPSGEYYYCSEILRDVFYHGEWSVMSNRESGDGFSDILIRIEDEDVGIVIEVKYASDGNMEKECENALQQITDVRYTEALKQEGIHKIIKYGIACYKKKCKVMMKSEE